MELGLGTQLHQGGGGLFQSVYNNNTNIAVGSIGNFDRLTPSGIRAASHAKNSMNETRCSSSAVNSDDTVVAASANENFVNRAVTPPNKSAASPPGSSIAATKGLSNVWDLGIEPEHIALSSSTSAEIFPTNDADDRVHRLPLFSRCPQSSQGMLNTTPPNNLNSKHLTSVGTTYSSGGYPVTGGASEDQPPAMNGLSNSCGGKMKSSMGLSPLKHLSLGSPLRSSRSMSSVNNYWGGGGNSYHTSPLKARTNLANLLNSMGGGGPNNLQNGVASSGNNFQANNARNGLSHSASSRDLFPGISTLSTNNGMMGNNYVSNNINSMNSSLNNNNGNKYANSGANCVGADLFGNQGTLNNCLSSLYNENDFARDRVDRGGNSNPLNQQELPNMVLNNILLLNQQNSLQQQQHSASSGSVSPASYDEAAAFMSSAGLRVGGGNMASNADKFVSSASYSQIAQKQTGTMSVSGLNGGSMGSSVASIASLLGGSASPPANSHSLYDLSSPNSHHGLGMKRPEPIPMPPGAAVGQIGQQQGLTNADKAKRHPVTKPSLDDVKDDSIVALTNKHGKGKYWFKSGSPTPDPRWPACQQLMIGPIPGDIEYSTLRSAFLSKGHTIHLFIQNNQAWLEKNQEKFGKKQVKFGYVVYTDAEVTRKLLSIGHVMVGTAKVSVKEMDGQPAQFVN